MKASKQIILEEARSDRQAGRQEDSYSWLSRLCPQQSRVSSASAVSLFCFPAGGTDDLNFSLLLLLCYILPCLPLNQSN